MLSKVRIFESFKCFSYTFDLLPRCIVTLSSSNGVSSTGTFNSNLNDLDTRSTKFLKVHLGMRNTLLIPRYIVEHPGSRHIES